MSNSRKIIVSLTGGLGNQLFQLAVALSLANDKNSTVKIEGNIGVPRLNILGEPEIFSFLLPSTVAKVDPRTTNFLIKKSSGYCLRMGVSPKFFEKFFIIRRLILAAWNLIVSLYFRKFLHSIIGKGVGYFDIPKPKGDVYLYGYFQSYKWVSESQVFEAMKCISIKSEFPEFEFFEKKAAVEKPLVVHVRLGDYKMEPNFGIMNLSYYSETINSQMATNKYKKIWIFSDEPDVALKLLPESYSGFYEVIPDFQNSAAKTLQVMRLGQGYVIANSTFSWWGAFLSFTENALVIAPEPWFKTGDSPKSIYPKHWIRQTLPIL